MADPDTSPGATPDRRGIRRDRNRRRAQRIAAIVAGMAVVVVAALVVTDVIRFSGDERPSLAGTVQADAPVASSTATTVDAPKCRKLSVNEPLRLWVGGDSLAGSLGPSLGRIAGATGVVQPYFDSRVSSGLSNPGFYNWPDHATTEMARIDPEVVVFIIGTNDFSAVTSTGDWKTPYSATVDSFMKTLVGNDRTVYWLGAPTLKDTQKDAAVVQVNAVAQEVAKKHPTVHYVDTYKVFSDENGKFAYDLRDETGKLVTMRSGDGIHFTNDGGDYLARQVYKLVDAQCQVTAQKVDGATKQAIQTPGSTQLGPSTGSSGSSGSSSGSSSSGSSGSSSGSSSQTTPAATTAAPVQTSPPTTQATTPPPSIVTTAPPTSTSVPSSNSPATGGAAPQPGTGGTSSK
jgi:hypothetical protein